LPGWGQHRQEHLLGCLQPGFQAVEPLLDLIVSHRGCGGAGLCRYGQQCPDAMHQQVGFAKQGNAKQRNTDHGCERGEKIAKHSIHPESRRSSR
jgi:hypothetical protein